jgi:hypothetical protein
MNTAVLDAGVSVTIHYEPATAEVISGSGGSTGPTATSIAAQVRIELASELAKIDAAISSRATAGDIFAAV